MSKAALTLCPLLSKSFSLKASFHLFSGQNIKLYLAFANDIKGVSCGPLSNDVVSFSVMCLGDEK